SLLRPGAGVAEKAALIEAEKENYPIIWMCDQLGLVRSSFYAWRARVGTVSASEAKRAALKVLIKEIYDEFNGVYGCRRIAAELNGRGHAASVGLVARLMRELGLAGVQKRAYRRTTVPDEQAQTFPDLLDGDFAAAHYAPGQALVGDISYLRTGQGWMYLATVIALAT